MNVNLSPTEYELVCRVADYYGSYPAQLAHEWICMCAFQRYEEISRLASERAGGARMSYVRIPGRTYDLIVNTALICFVQDSPRGMAVYFAGQAAPQLLSGDQCRPLLEALGELGAASPAGWGTDE